MTTATQDAIIETVVYKLRHGIDGGWPPDQLVRVSATATGHADWVRECRGKPEPYTGPIDPEQVAELNLTPPADFSVPSNADWTRDDLKRELNIASDEGLTIALEYLGVPRGRMRFETEGPNMLSRPTKAYQIWREQDIVKYRELVARVWPHVVKRG
jgi:hypothetical protein